MKQHTGMEAHDGFAPHSHEIRADHLGVGPDLIGWGPRTPGIDRQGFPIPDGWSVYRDGILIFTCQDWEDFFPGLNETMEG